MWSILVFHIRIKTDEVSKKNVLGRIFLSEDGESNSNLEKKGIARSSVNCTIYCIQFGDEVEESELGEPCRTL